MRKSGKVLLIALIAIVIGCSDDDDTSELVGSPGNPRFNLQFTNEENVDLDLYVRTPSGRTIYFGNTSADGGALDVDCLCSDCPNGPNENIFWPEDDSAPKGTYEVWVEYFGSCSEPSSSNFTLRIINNRRIINTYTGTLNTQNNKSNIYEYTKN